MPNELVNYIGNAPDPKTIPIVTPMIQDGGIILISLGEIKVRIDKTLFQDSIVIFSSRKEVWLGRLDDKIHPNIRSLISGQQNITKKLGGLHS